MLRWGNGKGRQFFYSFSKIYLTTYPMGPVGGGRKNGGASSVKKC